MCKLLAKVVLEVILGIISRYDFSELNILIDNCYFLSKDRLLVFFKCIALPLVVPPFIAVIVDNVGFILLFK